MEEDLDPHAAAAMMADQDDPEDEAATHIDASQIGTTSEDLENLRK